MEKILNFTWSWPRVALRCKWGVWLGESQIGDRRCTAVLGRLLKVKLLFQTLDIKLTDVVIKSNKPRVRERRVPFDGPVGNTDRDFSNPKTQKDARFDYAEWFALGGFVCKIQAFDSPDSLPHRWSSTNGYSQIYEIKSRIWINLDREGNNLDEVTAVPYIVDRWRRYHTARHLVCVLPSRFRSQRDLCWHWEFPSPYTRRGCIPRARSRRGTHPGDNHGRTRYSPLVSGDWSTLEIRDGRSLSPCPTSYCEVCTVAVWSWLDHQHCRSNCGWQ